MNAQPDNANRNHANDTEHNDDAGLPLSPVIALGQLHGDIARVEGVDGGHLCGIADGARCVRYSARGEVLAVSELGVRMLRVD